MDIFFKGGNTYIKSGADFDLQKTFDCGQCFRFEQDSGIFSGVHRGSFIRLSQSSDTVTLHGVNEDEFELIWRSFFDVDRDYGTIAAEFGSSCGVKSDATLSAAYECARGIRVLRQDPWETLISFIISQNNNIPRIKKIIRLLCESFGHPIKESEQFSFPTPQTLACLDIEALSPIRSGFRAKYIIDAARNVASGKVALYDLTTHGFEDAKTELLRIKGVGDKVAECVMLFSLGFYQAFPKDVWVRRVIEKYYGPSFSPEVFGEYAGIAQQYLFYYERYIQSKLTKK